MSKNETTDFEAKLRQIASFRDVIVAASAPVNSRLFHYTSGAGLLGIIQSNSIWLSESSFMNDGSERLWSRSIVHDVVQDLCEKTGKPEVKNFLHATLDGIDSTWNASSTYVFCLSGDGDLLNQWRDYGKDTVSYSIEFDVLQLVDKPPFFPLLNTIIYTEQSQKSVVEFYLSQILDIVDAVISDDKEIQEKSTISLANVASSVLDKLMTILKHPSFSVEREARLYSQRHMMDMILPDRMYRNSNIGLVPYYVFKMRKKLPILSIKVGPTRYPDIAASSVSMLLADNGYTDVEVTTSAIPLRA